MFRKSNPKRKGVDLAAFWLREAQKDLAKNLYDNRARGRRVQVPPFREAPEDVRAAYMELALTLIESNEPFSRAHRPAPITFMTGMRDKIPGHSNLIGMFGALMVLVLSVVGCDNQKVIGTAPSVIADPNAPAGKTRATQQAQIRQAAGGGLRPCTLSEDGSKVHWSGMTQRAITVSLDATADCLLIAGFGAFSVPRVQGDLLDPDPSHQGWLAQASETVFPGASTTIPLSYTTACIDGVQEDGFILQAPVDRQPPLGDDGKPRTGPQTLFPGRMVQLDHGTPIREIGLNHLFVGDSPSRACVPNTPPPPPPPPPVAQCVADIVVPFPAGSKIARFPAGVEPFYPDHIGPLTLSTPIPPATWTADAETWDNHLEKAPEYLASKQIFESGLFRLFSDLLGSHYSSPSLGPTTDIPDAVDTQVTHLGPFTLTETIRSIQFDHAGIGKPFPVDPVTGEPQPTDSFEIRSITFHCVRP